MMMQVMRYNALAIAMLSATLVFTAGVLRTLSPPIPTHKAFDKGLMISTFC